MSFIQTEILKPTYAPGWFLEDSEHCTRITKEIPATGDFVVTNADGTKYVPMGTFIGSPINGLVYEDVDVTTGAMPGSVVVAGRYYADRINGTVSGNNELINAGNAPTVTRPEGAEGATGATGATGET